MYLEIKGWMSNRNIATYTQVLNEHKIDLRVIVGKNEYEDFINNRKTLQELRSFEEYLKETIGGKSIRADTGL